VYFSRLFGEIVDEGLGMEVGGMAVEELREERARSEATNKRLGC